MLSSSGLCPKAGTALFVLVLLPDELVVLVTCELLLAQICELLVGTGHEGAIWKWVQAWDVPAARCAFASCWCVVGTGWAWGTLVLSPEERRF